MSSTPTITSAIGGSSGGGGPPGGSSGGGPLGGSSGSSSGGGGGGGGPCGACKFLRRKCVAGCIFAPYFDSEQGSAHFAAVHKVFGASNVSKMLQHVPVHKRLDAVVTICYEAQARLRNPVYGCVAHIFALQQQVVNLQGEISYLQAHLTNLELQTPAAPFQPPPPPQQPQPLQFSISDLPTASTMPATYDLSSLLFNPVVQWPPTHQHAGHHINDTAGDQYVTLAIPRPYDHTQAASTRSGGAGSSRGRGGGDLQVPAALRQHGNVGASATIPGSGALHGSSSEVQMPTSQPE